MADDARLNLRTCGLEDAPVILRIINAAAQAYRGHIPRDCWHEPYMSALDLLRDLRNGTRFVIAEADNHPVGVMALQPAGNLALIRHAYVLPKKQGTGIGSTLLNHLRQRVDLPLLVGTWADATWAIGFYERHGFVRPSRKTERILLSAYWSIPERQAEVSVALCGAAEVQHLEELCMGAQDDSQGLE